MLFWFAGAPLCYGSFFFGGAGCLRPLLGSKLVDPVVFEVPGVIVVWSGEVGAVLVVVLVLFLPAVFDFLTVCLPDGWPACSGEAQSTIIRAESNTSERLCMNLLCVSGELDGTCRT